MKKALSILASALVAGSAYGLSITNLPTIGAWPDGRTRINDTLTSISNQLTGTIAGQNQTVNTLIVTNQLRTTSTATTVTNGQILTLTAPVYYLSNTDIPEATNTLVVPTADGIVVEVYYVGTNGVHFADADAAVNLSGNADLAQGDSIILRGVISGTTTQWWESGQTDN